MSLGLHEENPPDWMRVLFAELYGEDGKGSGPSAVALVATALQFARALDTGATEGKWTDVVRRSARDLFASAGETDGGIAMLAEIERASARAPGMESADIYLDVAKTYLELLIEEIGRLTRDLGQR